MPDRPDDSIVFPAAPADNAQGMSVVDRRAERRYPLAATVEVFDIRSRARLTGRCADIGLGGCYIDTLSPFAIGSQVRIRIERDLRRFEAEAVVAYASVPMGMGLSFTAIKPEYQPVLQSWIAELSGERPSEAQMAPSGVEAGLLTAIENLRQVMNELINLMVRKNVITDDERAVLLRKIFR